MAVVAWRTVRYVLMMYDVTEYGAVRVMAVVAWRTVRYVLSLC